MSVAPRMKMGYPNEGLVNHAHCPCRKLYLAALHSIMKPFFAFNSTKLIQSIYQHSIMNPICIPLNFLINSNSIHLSKLLLTRTDSDNIHQLFARSIIIVIIQYNYSSINDNLSELLFCEKQFLVDIYVSELITSSLCYNLANAFN